MGRRYVSFILGSGRYCVPVDHVMQIVRPEGLLKVPEAPPFVAGAITLHGDVVPVIRLSVRLGLPATGPTETSRSRIIVTRVGSRSCGLAVDEVREIVEIDDAGIRADQEAAPGAARDLILGLAERGQEDFRLLDLPRVLGVGRDPQGAFSV